MLAVPTVPTILPPSTIMFSVKTELASTSLSGEASCHRFPASIFVAVVWAIISAVSFAVPTSKVALAPCRV
jgi:hypothetical protein